MLGVKVLENKHECCCCCCACDIPESVVSSISGGFPYDDDERRFLAVSLGMFSIIRIVRTGQYVINASEYIVPDKECVTTSDDDPCSVFKSMAFPTSEFGCTAEKSFFEKGNGKCGCGS